jgi:hypothetical protein
VVARLAGEWRRGRHCEEVATGIGWRIYDLMVSDGSTPMLDAVVLQSNTVLRRGEIVTLHNNRDSGPFSSVYGLARDECERFGIRFVCTAGRDYEIWQISTPHRNGLPEITYVRAGGERFLERYSPPP